MIAIKIATLIVLIIIAIELFKIRKELQSIRNEKEFTVPMLIDGKELARVTKNCYRSGNRG